MTRVFWVVGSLVAALFCCAAPAFAGQIVYTHGGDLWVMNDNGTGQRLLATQAQVGGSIQNSAVDPGVSVEPGSTGIAFAASVPASDGSCSGNCPGLWSLVGGKLTRLSPPPTDCSNGNPTITCQTDYVSPTVARNGNVIYTYESLGLVFGCGIYYCGNSGGYSWEQEFQPVDGSGSAAAWPLPAGSTANTDAGLEPGGFISNLASDPADPTKLVYNGNGQNSISCGQTAGASCAPLDVEGTSSGSPSVNQPSLDSGGYQAVAFSQDGSEIADIEDTTTPGIWVYPSSQSYTSNAPQFFWALKDPGQSSATSSNLVMNGLTFVGNDELVFSADDNLWSMTSSCWSTQANANSPAPQCGTFGASPVNVTQLTTDGTASNPDSQPAWTSSTATVASVGATNPAQVLTVSLAGNGKGTVTGSSINCPTTCTRSYAPGTSVTLTAASAGGSGFAGWSGACTGTGACTVRMISSQSVTASFALKPGSARPSRTTIGKAKINATKHTASFNFSARGARGFQCELIRPTRKRHRQPKPTFGSCRSPKTYRHLNAGKYKFLVRGVNSTGADRTPARKVFTIH
jgi:hypothetical protein